MMRLRFKVTTAVRLGIGCLGLSIILGFPTAAAGQEVIAYFGTPNGKGTAGGEFEFPHQIAVNSTGAGPAGDGDIYVVDGETGPASRIQRFAQDDNGTPGNPYDDTYPFIAAWGTDVDASGGGGGNYEICTVASECHAATSSGGNGTLLGDGDLGSVSGLAIDQDTGDVYVADISNNRINVYAGNGTFLRAFGYDVVESGPDDAGAGFEVCTAASGDVCKAGTSGPGAGQLSSPLAVAVSPADGSASSGTVYVSDSGNSRVNTYALDGTPISSFGTAEDFGGSFGVRSPEELAVDSRGIVYVTYHKSVPGDNGDIGRFIARYDSEGVNGGGVGFLAPIESPPLASAEGVALQQRGLAIDPDSDGPGPDGDALYVLRNLSPKPASVVQQFGPINEPGLSAPPTAADADHGAVMGFKGVDGLGLDTSSGRLFVSDSEGTESSPTPKSGVYVLDTAGGAPTASLDSLTDATATGVAVHATVDPNGPPNVSYRIEYSTDGVDWMKTPEVVVGSQEAPQSIDQTLSPGAGLAPNTLYHVRLVVTKAFMPAVVTAPLTFTTSPAPPLVETTGTPLRTTTTALLGGRVIPRSSETTYHFEYGPGGPCDESPCASTTERSAGSGSGTLLVAEPISGLEPGTTYHYRVVADNGNAGSPVYGTDMTVTTRTTEAPLNHGHFPGPPGSDRAYELISPPDTSSNPVFDAQGMSADGNRSLYSIAGGTPLSEIGSMFAFYFAERTPSGWQTKSVTPPRRDLVGSGLFPISGQADLSTFFAYNSDAASREGALWQFGPHAAPKKLLSLIPPEATEGQAERGAFVASTESARVFGLLFGGTGFDPEFPGAAAERNIYELTSGTPKLLSLLPEGGSPPCGVNYQPALGDLALTPDASFLFFRSRAPDCSGAMHQYVRDLSAGETRLLPGDLALLMATNDTAYFYTTSRLTSDDTVSEAAGMDGDVYSYELASDSFHCLTCVGAGINADVMEGPVVAEDGSRVYFQSRSTQPLVPGATANPDPQHGSTYVLETRTDELRWLGPGVDLGGVSTQRMPRDGAAIVFSSRDPGLNPAGGGFDNNGTLQLYRYDDRDRSLVCISCPQDGSPAGTALVRNYALARAEDGIVAFVTPNALVSADQNTSPPDQPAGTGNDVYEWRDGRLFLVTDGLTNWPREGFNTWPAVAGISEDGRDLDFLASAQYTPDALDSYRRLYDARVGGGFEYASAPRPCPLEVCQGVPKGAPEETRPGSSFFSGPGNARVQIAPRCRRGKHKPHHRGTRRRRGKGRCAAGPDHRRRRHRKHQRRLQAKREGRVG